MDKSALLENLRNGIKITYSDIKSCTEELTAIDRLQLEMKLQQRRFELLIDFAKQTKGRNYIYEEAEAIRKGLYLITGKTRYNMDGDKFISSSGRVVSAKQQNSYFRALQN